MNDYYQKRKERARAEAIEWQLSFCEHSYSYAECINFDYYFEKLGRRYGLLGEFRCNGII